MRREASSDLVRGTYSRKKSFTWFPTLAWAGWVDCSLPGREEEEQGRGRRQGFLPPISKKGVPTTMEPLVYLLVTDTTLTSRLAYLRQAVAMLHVVYASISILLDMGGARLIRDWGATKILSKWTPYCYNISKTLANNNNNTYISWNTR